MYTKCPECRTAFRVTVTVLRKAHGRVRCGGCSHVFDAIEHLHDEATGDEPEIGATGVRQRFVEQSEELLKSLDELAGPDEIRIEDTGVEWRVFDADDEPGDDVGTDDDAPAPDPDATGSVRWHFAAGDDDNADNPDDEAGDTRNFDMREEAGEETPAPEDDDRQAQAHLELEQDGDPDEQRAHRSAGEIRYDDNTPLPDDEAEQSGSDAADATPGRREEDWQPPPVADDLQVDLALGEPDDWQALLEEVATDRPDNSAGGGAREGEGDGPAIAGEAGEDDLTAAAATDSGTADPDTAAAEAQRTGNWMLVDDTSPDTVQPGDASFEAAAEQQLDAALAEAASGTDHGDDDEQASINLQIDQDLLRAVAEGSESQSGRYRQPDSGASGLFETIVMEGDSIRDTEDDDEDEDDSRASDAGAIAVASLESGSVTSTESAGGDEPTEPASMWPRVAAVVVLGLLLGLQLVHANRATLATWQSFDQVIGPLYRALGKAVMPEWNVRGWQFESTSGSADAADEILTIRSRIANSSAQPLPLPLVHVSLTDRYEEIIGSRVLEPADYLPESSGTNGPVAPGDAFTAVITVASPSAAATGFKLNVCYPFAGEQLRCAIEAFRD
ncbi:MAG: DUF3426 domain-containing protein [Woeseiaceae bacterium]|nr:DUF3426 domain-containing protein [Woeseiaceae bacterium]